MNLDNAVILFLMFQMFLLPMQALLWWGMRSETKKREHLLRNALKALGIIAVSSRGRNR